MSDAVAEPSVAEPCFSSPRRWLVLGAFGATAACNALMFMDFSTEAKISKAALHLPPDGRGDQGVQLMYTASLLAVLPATFPAAYSLVRAPWSTSLACVLFNIAGAWLRWLAVASGSWLVALISSVLVGFAASIIICSYTSLAERWFHPGPHVVHCPHTVRTFHAVHG